MQEKTVLFLNFPCTGSICLLTRWRLLLQRLSCVRHAFSSVNQLKQITFGGSFVLHIRFHGQESRIPFWAPSSLYPCLTEYSFALGHHFDESAASLFILSPSSLLIKSKRGSSSQSFMFLLKKRVPMIVFFCATVELGSHATRKGAGYVSLEMKFPRYLSFWNITFSPSPTLNETSWWNSYHSLLICFHGPLREECCFG